MNIPLRAPARITIRQNAAQDSVTVDTRDGLQVIQMSQLDPKKRRLAQELLVDFWCTEHGHPPVYG